AKTSRLANCDQTATMIPGLAGIGVGGARCPAAAAGDCSPDAICEDSPSCTTSPSATTVTSTSTRSPGTPLPPSPAWVEILASKLATCHWLLPLTRLLANSHGVARRLSA